MFTFKLFVVLKHLKAAFWKEFWFDILKIIFESYASQLSAVKI